jgi:transposase InsO family protein
VTVKKKDEEWALFWCTLLQPLLFGEIDEKDTQSFLKRLANEERRFPDGKLKRPSLSTLRRKLRKYRKGGFESLARKLRVDRGQTRAHPEKLVRRAIELKRDQPRRSHVTINKFLEVESQTTIPKSSLYRYLKKAGATRLKLGITKKKVRGRWSRDHTHALWVGDFEDGPWVLKEGEAVPTYFSGFIDCYSRDLVEGRYYYRENLAVLIDSLLRAWSVHGAPSELYVDWAKIYCSKALRAACYALNILLIHRGRGDPAVGGLIEKFIQTLQSQFEAEVRAGNILTLEELNRAFTAWLEMSYRRVKHSETGQPPRERYEEGLRVIRHVDMEKVLLYFMQRETRTVHPVFSDVRLAGRFYRVDKELRGDRVEVRYDPYSSPDTVLIYSLEEEYLGKGVLHNRERGEDAPPETPQEKPRYNYLELLVSEHEKELRAKTQGIDYRKALSGRSWPFPSFANLFAQLLGRKGGLTSFSQQELESLGKVYNRNPSLTEPLLREAFERAQEKKIPYIVWEIQKLNRRKEM